MTAGLPRQLEVFANRSLDLAAIDAIGYDMDYTLVYYRVEEWERAAFEHARDRLDDRGWPVADIEFDPTRFTIGLTFDVDLGNLVKATRFGRVVRAQHGGRKLTSAELAAVYRDTVVDLSEARFVFMNSLFELSRANLWSQLIAIHDETPLPGVSGYRDIYLAIDDALRDSHLGGALKTDILTDPDRFVERDPDVVATLLDQRAAGKRLLLITNSDWAYTNRMMTYTLDAFCPPGITWRDLFDIIIASANKPQFFTGCDPIYRIVDEQASLLLPHTGPLETDGIYFGGNARLVENWLPDPSNRPLYVGDHLFGDVHITKDVLRWRTALVARELETEIADDKDFSPYRQRLMSLQNQRSNIDRRVSAVRLQLLRRCCQTSTRQLAELREERERIDAAIEPLVAAANRLGNPIWGPLMRAAADKSLFARQVEKYADVYTSRVSNFRHATPFARIRATPGSLPHDHDPATDG